MTTIAETEFAPGMELAPGVFWVTTCNESPAPSSTVHRHGYTNVYLVAGEKSSVIVDGGHPRDWEDIVPQLDALRADGVPEVEWIVPTHAEVVHSGCTGKLLDRYPNARVAGEVRDYHLIFPYFADRLVPMKIGDTLDLGNRTFEFVEAVVRDIPSIWGFDHSEGVLFAGDAFGLPHYDDPDQCLHYADDLGDLPIETESGFFHQVSLFWTRHKDIEPTIDRLKKMINEDYPVRSIAASHGPPIRNLEVTLPRMYEAMRLTATMTGRSSFFV